MVVGDLIQGGNCIRKRRDEGKDQNVMIIRKPMENLLYCDNNIVIMQD